METEKLLSIALIVTLMLVSGGVGAIGGAIYQDRAIRAEFQAIQAEQVQLTAALDAQRELAETALQESYDYQELLYATMGDLVLMFEEMIQKLRADLVAPNPRVQMAATIDQVAFVIAEANKLLDAVHRDRIATGIVLEATASGIDPLLVTAMAYRESNFRVDARGKAGEYGLLQIMPGTGRWIAGRLGYQDYDPAIMSDVDINIQFSVFYLDAVTRDMDKLFKPATAEERMWLGVLAYNAGPGGARRWIEAGNRVEDHFYVRRVQATYNQIKGA